MLADFSGYIAADELYDGPFCVLSIVDNGRHRKMQKTVYRVRTHRNINGRIALDMQRDERTQTRDQTTKTLHAARPRMAA